MLQGRDAVDVESHEPTYPTNGQLEHEILVSSGEPDQADHASKPNQRDLLLTRILRPQEADAIHCAAAVSDV